MQKKHALLKFLGLTAFLSLFQTVAFASDAELKIPQLNTMYTLFGNSVSGTTILGTGMIVAVLGMLFGIIEFFKIKKLPAHKSMLEVSALIYETCKTYLFQQMKFLAILEVLIGGLIFYYFYALQHLEFPRVVLILTWSILGILGSVGVAWFGIRINTFANSRTAFSSLAGKPYPVMDIPL